MSERSHRFHSADADVTFRSSDNVLFSIHSKNLEAHTTGFPPAEFLSHGEIVPLQEGRETLELLFSFVYPTDEDLPDVDHMDFDVVFHLAEAAEKYGVSMLIRLCRNRLKSFIPGHEREILSYACIHNHPELINDIIPRMLQEPAASVGQILPPRYFLAWTIHMEEWRYLIAQMLKAFAGRPAACHTEMGMAIIKITAALNQLEKVEDFSSAVQWPIDTPVCCSKARTLLSELTAILKREVVDKFPKFTEILQSTPSRN